MNLTALVWDFLTYNPQSRTVFEHERQSSRFTFEESDLLLKQVAEKNRTSVPLVPSLMEVRLPLGIQMLKRPLNCDPSTIGKAQLRGPRIETNLADFQPHQKL